MQQADRTRAWIFDALMECGQKLAMVNHLEEKIVGLYSRLEETDDDKTALEITDKIGKMRTIVEITTEQRRKLMDYIMGQASSSDEERCLLKHALLDYTIATELFEANTDDAELEYNMRKTSESLAAVISLTLNMEFKTCLRCVADYWKFPEDEYVISNTDSDNKETNSEWPIE